MGTSAWSGRLDLNQRPLAPHASALATCATPRRFYILSQDVKISTLMDFQSGDRDSVLCGVVRCVGIWENLTLPLDFLSDMV